MSAVQNEPVSEIQTFCRGLALAGKELDDHAPRLAASLRECSAYLGASSPVDALEAVLDRIRADDYLTFLGDSSLAGKGRGEDWAMVLDMMLNSTRAEMTLTARRSQFEPPSRLMDAYNIGSTGSSTVRVRLEHDAAAVLVARIETLVPVASGPLIRPNTGTPANVRSYLRKLIAQHGLNDDLWAEAISAQYFVCLLARRLHLTHREDYSDLLNRFLESFTYRVDDTIILNEKRVVVTPEETEKMRSEMLAEDERDPYYRYSDKTRASAIDTQDLHVNYLYGLTLGISAPAESKILETLRRVAATHLFGGGAEGSRSLDLDGGWRPYRMPWLTARVLICIADLPREYRASLDAEEVVQDAVLSLIDRLTQRWTWRGGVGDWISEWEATGLCLEALLLHARCLDNYEQLDAVGAACIGRYEEWAVSPSFNTGDAANATLSAVILATSLVALAGAPGAFALTPEQGRQLRGLVMSALEVAVDTVSPQTQQFCTIPQIAFYSSKIL